MQVSAMRDGHDVTGYVFSTVDITPSHRSREALIDTGIALSRTIVLDRVLREVTQQMRRAIPCDGLAIAIRDDESGALRLAHHTGYEDIGEGLEAELRTGWLDALANGDVVVSHSSRGVELTAPMVSSEGVVGAMTVLSDRIESLQRLDEAERVLATVAAQTAAAIERAWLVRRVEQKRRMEAIGEVAAGVAHELRNPLFGISSAAQLLRFRAREDPVVEKNVGRILREVERLNRMVTSLLEYGRPNPVRLAPGDPDAVWDDVLEIHRGRLESQALTLTRQRPSTHARCAIDVEQLTQVFVNVLFNAIEAAPQTTELTLRSEVLPSGTWRCRLHNGGPAIPAEVLPRVFEIFFSTKPGGTGIGLALCQRIIEEHGGTIALESAADNGTTATIVLPVT
jgi:signal transduction histidine kinase